MGTQTVSTPLWTGEASFFELKDGQQIAYWLSQCSGSNVTLTLTLADGTVTDAIPCYYDVSDWERRQVGASGRNCKMMNTPLRRTTNALKWSTMSEFTAKLISPLTTMLLARLLTPDAFGVEATITIAVSFSEVLADAGFQKYVVQHECEENEQLSPYLNVAFWSNLLFSLTIYLLIVIFCNPISRALGNTDIQMGLCVSGISILVQALMSIQLAYLRREMAFRKLFRIRFIGSAANLLVTVPLAYFFSTTGH